MKTLLLDKYGWPVEQIKGRWFQNWLRRTLHGRERVCRECRRRALSRAADSVPIAGCDSTPARPFIKTEGNQRGEGAPTPGTLNPHAICDLRREAEVRDARRETIADAVRVVEGLTRYEVQSLEVAAGEIGEHPDGEYIDRDEALSTLRALTRTPGRNRHPGQQED